MNNSWSQCCISIYCRATKKKPFLVKSFTFTLRHLADGYSCSGGLKWVSKELQLSLNMIFCHRPSLCKVDLTWQIKWKLSSHSSLFNVVLTQKDTQELEKLHEIKFWIKNLTKTFGAKYSNCTARNASFSTPVCSSRTRLLYDDPVSLKSCLYDTKLLSKLRCCGIESLPRLFSETFPVM